MSKRNIGALAIVLAFAAASAFAGPTFTPPSSGTGFTGTYSGSTQFTGDHTQTGNMHVTGSADIDTGPFQAQGFTVSAVGDVDAAGNGHFAGSLDVDTLPFYLGTNFSVDASGNLEAAGMATFGGANKVEIRAGTNATTSLFIGNDAGDVADMTGAGANVGIGEESLGGLTSGDRNTMLGKWTGRYFDVESDNTGIGSGVMASLLYAGQRSTAVGADALGSANGTDDVTALGYKAFNALTTGDTSIAIGSNAAIYHADGSTALTDPDTSVYIGYSVRGKDNSDSNSIVIGANAIGQGANTTQIGNASTTMTNFGAPNTIEMRSGVNATTSVFIGNDAGDVADMTGATASVGVGENALSALSTGDRVVAIGKDAGLLMNSGSDNVALGARSLDATTSSSFSVAVGTDSLGAANSAGNTAIGDISGQYITNGSYSVFVGRQAGNFHADGSTQLTTAANSVYIGNNVKGKDNSDSNSIVIGANAIGQGANTFVHGNGSIVDQFLPGEVHINGSSDVAGHSKLFSGSKSAITDNTATGVIAITTPSNGYCGVTIDYTAVTTDATDYQAHHGAVTFALVNKGGTTYCDESTEAMESTAASTGTFATDTWACADGGTSPDTINFTIDSTLNSDATLYWHATVMGSTGCAVAGL